MGREEAERTHRVRRKVFRIGAAPRRVVRIGRQLLVDELDARRRVAAGAVETPHDQRQDVGRVHLHVDRRRRRR